MKPTRTQLLAMERELVKYGVPRPLIRRNYVVRTSTSEEKFSTALRRTRSSTTRP